LNDQIQVITAIWIHIFAQQTLITQSDWGIIQVHFSRISQNRNRYTANIFQKQARNHLLNGRIEWQEIAHLHCTERSAVQVSLAKNARSQ
jgi:hypothetical protein